MRKIIIPTKLYNDIAKQAKEEGLTWVEMLKKILNVAYEDMKKGEVKVDA